MTSLGSRFSIAQRLAIGFGLFFAAQLLVLYGVFIWLEENDRAQDEYVTQIAPRAAQADRLKQAVYSVAIAVRDQLLEPTPAHAGEVEQAAARARQVLEGFAALRVAVDRDTRYAEVRGLAERYVAHAEATVGKPFAHPREALAGMRETTLAALREFSREEQAASRLALEAMAENRRRISRALVWLALLSGALFLAIAWTTVQSIRRPVNALIRVASALEAGNWRSALALTPPSPEASAEAKDEMLRLGYAFGAAAAALESREQQLQQQNEELQAQNEEIQAQNEEIQAQNEEIQAQSEEIQAQNADLASQALTLREHAQALRDADEKKNEFLGLLAHELRNPLAPMSNSLALLKRANPAGDTNGAYAILERQLRHLVRLIDDLLDVTRISRGKVHVRREALDLARLLRNCAADLNASTESKGLRLELALPSEPIWVEGDDTRLSQVFGNVLGNAIKFTEAGGRICVTAIADEKAREACVRVRDSGRGMEPTLLKRLFTPFSQGDNDLARSSGGLGLGLALVKGLVELHGGRVQALSEGPGRGSELVVCLPLCRGRGARPGSAVAYAAPQAVPSRRILLIEDNPDAAQTLSDLLRADGHQVMVEHSGRAGVEAARRFSPEIVLCDIGLPGMDGYAVARTLRGDSSLAQPVLIALTGYATGADQQRTAEAGFDHHFAKPPDLARLNNVFAQLEGAGAE